MTISLSAIHIYPVKALGGISLAHSMVTSRGLQNDRRFMVVDANNELLTQREYPKMATVWVEIDNGNVIFSAPDVDSISFPATPAALPARSVRVWSSHVRAQAVSAQADRWLSQYLGTDAWLVYMPESSHRPVDPAYVKGECCG